MRVPVAVLGAMTPAGQEILRVVHMHPMLEVRAISDAAHEGMRLGDVIPAWHASALSFQETAAVVDAGGLVINALGLADSCEMFEGLAAWPTGLRMIDLSPALLPLDAGVFQSLYGLRKPPAPAGIEALEGLTWRRESLFAKADFVSVPGPVAHAIWLALVPYARAGMLHSAAQVSALCSELAGQPCEFPRGPGIGDVHQFRPMHHPQAWEAAHLTGVAGVEIDLMVHQASHRRGLVAHVFFNLGEGITLSSVDHIYREMWEGHPFVRLVDQPPQLRDVVGTHQAHLFLRAAGNTMGVVVALDDLGRGSAMQAVECANLMLGLPEDAGLTFAPCLA